MLCQLSYGHQAAPKFYQQALSVQKGKASDTNAAANRRANAANTPCTFVDAFSSKRLRMAGLRTLVDTSGRILRERSVPQSTSYSKLVYLQLDERSSRTLHPTVRVFTRYPSALPQIPKRVTPRAPETRMITSGVPVPFAAGLWSFLRGLLVLLLCFLPGLFLRGFVVP
jgi:hypothetical protein